MRTALAVLERVCILAGSAVTPACAAHQALLPLLHGRTSSRRELHEDQKQSLTMVSHFIFKTTPAHWAAYSNATGVLWQIASLVNDNTRLTEVLLKRNWLNMTVVHMATYQGHVPALLVLLELEFAGRLSGDVFSIKDVWGKTPVSPRRALKARGCNHCHVVWR